MSISATLIGILLAILLGAMSPGPSLAVVLRSSIGLSRRAGLATAAGMGVGGLFFSVVALAGLYTLLASVEWLYLALKIAGGAYLIYLAIKIWRDAPHSVQASTDGELPAQSLKQSFWTGLSTQLSNPKTAIVYGSIFAALLPQHPPVWCYAVLPALIFLVEAGWYSVVALCFSSPLPRRLYLRAKKWIDRLAAGAIAALGLRLVASDSGPGL